MALLLYVERAQMPGQGVEFAALRHAVAVFFTLSPAGRYFTNNTVYFYVSCCLSTYLNYHLSHFDAFPFSV